MADDIRIGFVGVGNMGQAAHLYNYAAIPGCKVVALAEPKPELGKRVAAKYAVPAAYVDYQDMLAKEELDGIVAVQYFGAHGWLLPSVLEAGKPTIIEKPIGNSVHAGQQVLDAATDGNVPLYVGYHKRSDPAVQHAVAVIDDWRASGKFGAMKYVRITMPPGDWIANGFSHLLTSDEPLGDLRVDPKPEGMSDESWQLSNFFVNFYIHQVNLMRHLFRSDYSIAWADPAQVVIATRSDEGVTGLLEMAPFSTTIDWQEVCLVCFERGWVKVELPAPVAVNRPGRVTIFEDGQENQQPRTIEPQLPWVHAMRRQAEQFVAAVRGEGSGSLCGAEEALQDMRVAADWIEAMEKTR